MQLPFNQNKANLHTDSKRGRRRSRTHPHRASAWHGARQTSPPDVPVRRGGKEEEGNVGGGDGDGNVCVWGGQKQAKSKLRKQTDGCGTLAYSQSKQGGSTSRGVSRVEELEGRTGRSEHASASAWTQSSGSRWSLMMSASGWGGDRARTRRELVSMQIV